MPKTKTLLLKTTNISRIMAYL